MSPNSPVPVIGSKTSSRWSQDRRLAFIDFRLRWEGHINRSDITEYFGISVPQASLDIARYLELAPHNLSYDRRSRTYHSSATFQPQFGSSNSSNYLNDLLAYEAGLLDSEASFIGWRPATALVPTPGRQLNSKTLALLLEAIREGTGAQVVYQSMSHPEPQTRTLSPHALAYDGYRWHVRAYCHSRKQFRDFVIARILDIAAVEVEAPGPVADTAWAETIELVLVPNPKLSLAHRRVIELDYEMVDGEVVFRCKKALAFYVLRYMGLGSAESETPEAQQIVLKNKSQVNQVLQEFDAIGSAH